LDWRKWAVTLTAPPPDGLSIGNNALNLDNQNGGFTVFGNGQQHGGGVDALASLPIVNAGGAFTDLPLLGHRRGNIQKQIWRW
jgi:hypothetical protein